MIRVSLLTKRFGSTVAVDGLSFHVSRGEVVGFLGPNGAGKTTTIRVLTGYHAATAGSASIAGHDVATASLEARRQIGYLPENVPIYPDLRVIEYLRYRAALKGVPAREIRLAVDRAMEKAGLVEDAPQESEPEEGEHDESEHEESKAAVTAATTPTRISVARKLCGHVSRGYRQRVGLADALVANPPILILDEPTSGLDPNQRRRIKQVVRDLAAEHTILFSSHILGEVQDVSSRILVIHRGRLRADGSPHELVTQSAQYHLNVVVKCNRTELAEAMAGITGLHAGDAATRNDGVTSMRCVVERGVDPRAELGQRLLRAGIAVHELAVEQPTLEEYFYAVTEGSDRSEEAALPAPQNGAPQNGAPGDAARTEP
jgi:ABC-2 type transport system ATP-binding protein